MEANGLTLSRKQLILALLHQSGWYALTHLIEAITEKILLGRTEEVQIWMRKYLVTPEAISKICMSINHSVFLSSDHLAHHVAMWDGTSPDPPKPQKRANGRTARDILAFPLSTITCSAQHWYSEN